MQPQQATGDQDTVHELRPRLFCFFIVTNILSGPAVKPQDQRAASLILSSSMFYSLTPSFMLLSRTWSVYLQFIHSNS